MARTQYVGYRPSAGSWGVIEQANSICQEYAQQGYDLTLRQLYYQFVARGLVENNQRSYKRIGSIVNDARMGGLMDWSYIVDRTRNLSGVSHWREPSGVIRSAAHSYRIDKRADQEVRVEVWVEKEALAGVVGRTCSALDVDYFSCRGYVSQSEQRAAAMRFASYLRLGQRVVLVHLGDHDPSGVDMTRDIEERISRFLTVDLGALDPDDPPDPHQDRWLLSPDAEGEFARPYALQDADVFYHEPLFQVRRIALNYDQVELYKPPPNWAKVTDSRAGGYIERYGDESWELDALEPQVLDRLIRAEVQRWTQPELWNALVDRETAERESLTLIADNYGQLTWPGKEEVR